MIGGTLIQTFELSVFPELQDRAAIYINMDEVFAQPKVIRAGKSLLLDAEVTQRHLQAEHRKESADYSFGGYLEDRRNLWAGSYLEPDKAVHLGIDINAPAGTAVAPAHAVSVAKIIHDPDNDGGWGSVIIFKLYAPMGDISHFIYAHLGKDSVTVREGDKIAPGTAVARLGQPHENGGWYEHLHFQALTPEGWAMVEKGGLAAIDGYDAMPAPGKEHPVSPDPMRLLFK